MFFGLGFWGVIGCIVSKYIKVVMGICLLKSCFKILNCKVEEERMKVMENESD